MIESLEKRIAPAGVVHYVETDGDIVTVKTSKGTNTDLLGILTDQNGTAITEGKTGVNGVTVNFIKNATTAGIFAGTDLTISASGGNVAAFPTTAKLANFVKVNGFDGNGANNIDLNKVTIKGDLVFIDAGDNTLTTPAIAKLDVTNWHADNGFTAATSSQIRGDILSIKVKNNFDGFIISNKADGTANFQDSNATVIGSLTVGKNIAQRNGDDAGHIQVHRIATLTVKGTFFGSSNGSMRNGLIEADSIGKISIAAMSVNPSIVLT
ncbi:MAG: hypothetical protein QOE70_5118 [Chthoniobacter sp.]|jgi:hypothetical protein|nr:hypothetical protein [Chthoniobacter sp.]